jgi:hypothetical protein
MFVDGFPPSDVAARIAVSLGQKRLYAEFGRLHIGCTACGFVETTVHGTVAKKVVANSHITMHHADHRNESCLGEVT